MRKSAVVDLRLIPATTRQGRFGTDITQSSHNADAVRERPGPAIMKGQKMLLQQVARQLTAWLNRGRDIENLRHTDDRLLADMGIRREDIRRRVRGR